MDYDEILEQIGEYGRWQKRVFSLLFIGSIIVPLHWFGTVFYQVSGPHWCSPPPHWVNENCTEFSLSQTQCKELKKNLSVPIFFDANTGSLVYSQCVMYDVRNISFPPLLTELEDVDEISCQYGWEYDTTEYGDTVINKYDIVCENSHKDELSHSLFFVGCLGGSFFFGYIADWLGRRNSWAISLALVVASSLLTMVSNNYWFYVSMRILTAMAGYGTWLLPFILASELVGPVHRMTFGIIIELAWAVGYMVLPIMAWLIRDWRYLQLAITALSFGVFFLLLFTPESVRWLISVGRYENARKIVKDGARENKRTIPQKLLEVGNTEKIGLVSSSDNAHVIGPIDIFTSPVMFIRLLIISISWFAHALAYMGLSMGVDLIGLNIYLSFFLSGAAEVPACVFAALALLYLGRRSTTVAFMIIGGVCLCLNPLHDHVVYTASLALVSKFAVTASFVTVIVYTNELFPTSVRGFAAGTAGCVGLLANILSPYVLSLDKVWEHFPSIIFGGLLIPSALLLLLLPETRGTFLPQTMEEAILLGKKDKKGQTEAGDAASL